MPVNIVGAMITFLQSQQFTLGGVLTNVSVWDGEVPRYDVNGNPINPAANYGSFPKSWPVITAKMDEAGFAIGRQTEDPTDEQGQLMIEVWGISRAQVHPVLQQIYALLAQASNWGQDYNPQTINMGGDPRNPDYVIDMRPQAWTVVCREGERTDASQFIYYGAIRYEPMCHSVASSL